MGAFVIWLGLRLGTAFEGGFLLLESLPRLQAALETPFEVQLTAVSLKTAGAFLAAYALCVLLYLTTRGNTRPGEEHGSAKWGRTSALTAAYKDTKNEKSDTLLTEHIRVGRNSKRNLANLNTLVIGGPGSGKSYKFVKPNLLQLHGSYIISDPKGELLRDVAPALIAHDIPFNVLNLADKSLSDCYNPFEYIREDADVLKLVTNLIKNTTPRGSSQSEPFWEKAETALVSAFMLYLKHEVDPSQQNFSMLCELIENAAASEEDEGHVSAVDLLFDDLEEREPGHIALKYYNVFKQSAGKTAKSILVSAAVRLHAFNLPEVARITRRDDMKLGELGDTQRYIFCVIPDNDTSLNFIVGMLYTQAFQELYRNADRQLSGRLNVPVRVMMDEFPNVALPDDFERVLSTCRGREIYINIIIQNIAQLKSLFKDGWETITGDCAVLLYLGGNEQSTHEYISKMLGKQTIDTRTRGVSKGRQGSSSTNHQNTGRELMLSDEVRSLGKDDALVFLQSEPPARDRKYNTPKHPHYKISALGGAESYRREPVTIVERSDLGQLGKNYKLSITLED